ncbi:MAG: alpha-L-glutamate ligase-like protein [Arenicella sp.]|nr:alpha-L-glutamate ligase-like protein [Arenicella sp.]
MRLVSPQSLRRAGVVGINQRNAHYISRANQRHLYPLVDNKLLTKQLALDAGIAVPELFATIENQGDVRRLRDIIGPHRQFVMKPAHGSGGDGIMVIGAVTEKGLRRHDGTFLSYSDAQYYASTTLSGQYSLAGLPDKLMIEYRVLFDPLFEKIAYQGIPDIRVIVFYGYPVMAMVRLPTRASDGKANLHQGAIGVGIDLATGITSTAVSGNEIVAEHPDTGHTIAGLEIPDWSAILQLAARCYEITNLGYLGVDIVLDKSRGPLILELNARPGLNIQIANSCGLGKRLDAIEQLNQAPADFQERVYWSRRHLTFGV